jgi:integrase
MTDISKVKHRNALKPRREPYWHKISQSNHLGFRKLTSDSQGTWLARTYDNLTLKKPQKRLGAFLEFPDTLRFEMAQKAAQEWFTHLGRGGSTEEVTIQNVCDNYVEHLEQKGKEKGSIDASKRFKAYVLDDPRFANTPLSKLTPKLVQAWRNRLSNKPTKAGKNKGEKRTDSSLNRDMTPFRAALNLAKDQRLTTDDFAWSKTLRPIKDADKSRDIYLTIPERNLIIEASPPDLAQFIKFSTLLPLRPGAIAKLTVGDFNKTQRTLFIPADKANANRKLPLGNQLINFLEEATKNKLPKALIFNRSNGAAWEKHSWKQFKEIANKAGITSAPTLYSIRHSIITDLIEQGAGYGTVAIWAGTSIRIIEKNYRHLTASHSANALDRLAYSQSGGA